MSGYKLAGLAPAYKVVAVTPSDATVLAPTRGLWVGGAGAVAVVMLDGTTAVFSGVAAGTQLDLCVSKVLSTGTVGTLILALY
jgi:hypothetical protein